MKKITLLAALFISAASFAQIAATSFETPAIPGGQYLDLGDAATAHALPNNDGEPILNFTAVAGGEMGYSASYVPYDEPGAGLTDGDFVGVTDFTPSGADYTDGVQGYQITDADGTFVLEFDVVSFAGISTPGVRLDYFVAGDPDPAESSWEGDGTENASSSDRLRIYVKDLTNNTEVDILNTTGSDIDDLGIEGSWITGVAAISPNAMVQLVVEARMNSGSEAIFLDNVVFDGTLGINTTTANQFEVFPNPANNVLNISTSKEGETQVTIFDVLGKQVLSTQKTNNINIAGLTSGVYIVKVSQNNVVATKKLIVQ